MTVDGQYLQEIPTLCTYSVCVWATSDNSWPLEQLNLSSRALEVITRSWFMAAGENVTILAVSSVSVCGSVEE